MNHLLLIFGESHITKFGFNFDTTLKKAAIQFPYFNNIVSSCVLGMNTARQVNENISDYNNKLSDEFWKFLYDNELIDKRSKIK